MAFWIFMMAMDLLTPAMMLLIGLWFRKHPPEDINCFIGYRTSMSMKNQDTWDFAHKCCGKIWLWTGLVLLPASIIAMLFFIGKDTDTVSLAGVAVLEVQLLILVGSILPVELSLKKAFHKDGSRRK